MKTKEEKGQNTKANAKFSHWESLNNSLAARELYICHCNNSYGYPAAGRLLLNALPVKFSSEMLGGQAQREREREREQTLQPTAFTRPFLQRQNLTAMALALCP